MNSASGGCTPSEMIAVCIGREIVDGDVVGLGLGTILPLAGALLAQRRQAPQSVLFYSPVGAYVRSLPRLTVSLADWIAEPSVIARPNLAELFTQELHERHIEFFRPAQIDRFGRFNVTVIGRLPAPKVRLPGAAGIPDVTAVFSRLFFYVPRHDPRCFVPEVDFVSGCGSAHRLYSDLGVFDFGPEGMRALSLHHGVAPADVRRATGFEVDLDSVSITEVPSAEELELLRHEIDPFGIVELEAASAKHRRDRLLEIYSAERRAVDRMPRLPVL